MKRSTLILLSSMSLTLAACEMPDIAGMNKMPKQTEAMGEKMDATNESIRQQKLLLAVEQLNDPGNRKNISPVPTGLMPAGKVFAETATAEELINYTYNELKKIEFNQPVFGIDADGYATALDEKQQAEARKEKKADLSALWVIAGFTPDAKIDEIIRHDINGNSRFADTAYQFLALRSYFLREVLLNLSLEMAEGMTGAWDTSGKMNEAIKYLLQLDKISKMKFKKPIACTIEAEFIKFNEVMDQAGRQKTAQLWKKAVEKAQDGAKAYTTASKDFESDPQEIQKQEAALKIMQSYAESWKSYLK